MRIAIMGGTFDPVHFGHLRVSEEVREAFSLDRVFFMPAAIPPHKTDEKRTEASHRLQMTRLAVSGNPAFTVSDMEIKRGGRSFTIDTVRDMLNAQGPAPDISLVIGSDAFNDISTWCEYEELLRLSSLIVVPRPGYAVKKPAEALPVELARKFWYDSEGLCYATAEGRRISFADTTLFAISSSDIRRRISNGLSVRYLMPDAVIEYIAGHGLYK
jgi:nicotinate-nucleotide adenylyltransferase